MAPQRTAAVSTQNKGHNKEQSFLIKYPELEDRNWLLELLWSHYHRETLVGMEEDQNV